MYIAAAARFKIIDSFEKNKKLYERNAHGGYYNDVTGNYFSFGTSTGKLIAFVIAIKHFIFPNTLLFFWKKGAQLFIFFYF